MRRLLSALALLLPLLPTPSAHAAGPSGDPSTWTDRQLAAQLVLAGYDMSRTDDAIPWVREGLGGVVLFGTPPSDLTARLKRLRAAGTVVPMVASDEEGGRVQRLRSVLGALPSAEELGHLNVPGLTERGVPATLSPNAYRYLRERAGAARLLMTDSLSMGAISIGMRLSPAQAAVRALSAGADVVLVDPGPGPGPVVDAVAAALTSGSYARSSAVASARRMLAVKRTTNAPLPMSSLSPAQGTTEASLTPTLSGIARDRIGGTLTAQFFVRSAGTASWNVANGARVTVTSGLRASYRLGAGRLQPGRTYEWSVRPCNTVSVCAPPGPVLRFTTG